MASHTILSSRLFKKHGILSVAAITAAMSLQAASAANYYWVPTDKTGNIWWDTYNDTWSLENTGTPGTYPNTAGSGHVAIFDTTPLPGTSSGIMIQGGVTFYCAGIEYRLAGFNLAPGNSDTSRISTGNDTALTLTVYENVTATLNLIISNNTNGLIVTGGPTGAGTLILQNSKNELTGDILLQNGASLAIGNSTGGGGASPHGNILGQAENVHIGSGSSFIAGGGGWNSSFSGNINQNFLLGTDDGASGNTTINILENNGSGSRAMTFSGSIKDADRTDDLADSLTFRVGANATLILTGENTYTGDTILQTGLLKLEDEGSIANSAKIDVKTGATFDVSAVDFMLSSGQTLTGSGTGKIVGDVFALPDSILDCSGGLTITNGEVWFDLRDAAAGLAVGEHYFEFFYLGSADGTFDFEHNVIGLPSGKHIELLDPLHAGGIVRVGFKILASEVVPEPTSLAILGLGAAGLLARRRR